MAFELSAAPTQQTVVQALASSHVRSTNSTNSTNSTTTTPAKAAPTPAKAVPAPATASPKKSAKVALPTLSPPKIPGGGAPPGGRGGAGGRLEESLGALAAVRPPPFLLFSLSLTLLYCGEW